MLILAGEPGEGVETNAMVCSFVRRVAAWDERSALGNVGTAARRQRQQAVTVD